MCYLTGFTDKACEVLQLAIFEAKKTCFESITTAHLLYGLAGVNGSISAIILNSLIKPSEIEEKIPQLKNNSFNKQNQNNFTPLVKQILEKSKKKAKILNISKAGTEHILSEFLQEEENFGMLILLEKNIAIETIYIKCLAYNFNWLDNVTTKNKKQTTVLTMYGKDLTKLAKSRKLDPLIGRTKELQRIIQTLTRRKKNNPCLIGEAGVGKTAIVEGLSEKIAKGIVPASLKNKKVISLDIAAMLSGTKYRGEFEERLKNVLIMSEKDNGIILFIDEIHNIVGTGAAEGAIDAANILKPKLAKGEIQLIGATTIEEYSKYIEADPALERRFQPILVDEPTKTESIKILDGIKQKYEIFHNIKISNNSIKSAVDLSIRYIPDRFLPDKAIDLIDEAAARKNLTIQKTYKQSKMPQFKDKSTKKLHHLLTTKDILNVISLWTNIPIKQLNKNDIYKLNKLENEINKQIFGQKKAISSLVSAIKRNKTGISSEKKPIGTFLFVGPTGVGKTALCLALAKTFYGSEKNLIKLDMSEYKESNSISKIIGAPPGYIGFDKENPLTNKIKRSPYLVVVFDEIEKAHPDIYNLLLQVMDEGTITDSHSRKVNFKNCIIILTSNLSCQKNSNINSIGFSQTAKKQQYIEKINTNLKKTFKSEFLSRIDDIIIFEDLTKRVIKNIITKQLNELKNRLKKLNHKFIYTTSAVNLILRLNGSNKNGARSIKNIITKNVENLISNKLLTETINKKSKITLDNKNNNLIVKIERI